MVEPTGYTALDLIGFTDRGNYNPATNYVKNDLVHYGGSIWKVLIDDTEGQTPQEGIYYTVFVQEPTNMVERIMAPLEQNPATQAWAVGRQIINNDYLYEVIAPIAIGDNLVAYEDDPTNANIKLAPPIETQVLAIKKEADMAEDMIAPSESNPAAASHSVGDQIIFDNILYDVTSPIAANDALVAYPTAGYNIKPAATISSQIQALANEVGDLTDLDTTVKTDLVSAINECVVEIEESGIVKVTTPSFSSLPQTYTATGIDGDYELAVDGFALVSPSSAMGGDWNINTAANSITISGTFIGSNPCSVKMSLTKPVKAITAS